MIPTLLKVVVLVNISMVVCLALCDSDSLALCDSDFKQSTYFWCDFTEHSWKCWILRPNTHGTHKLRSSLRKNKRKLSLCDHEIMVLVCCGRHTLKQEKCVRQTMRKPQKQHCLCGRNKHVIISLGTICSTLGLGLGCEADLNMASGNLTHWRLFFFWYHLMLVFFTSKIKCIFVFFWWQIVNRCCSVTSVTGATLCVWWRRHNLLSFPVLYTALVCCIDIRPPPPHSDSMLVPVMSISEG